MLYKTINDSPTGIILWIHGIPFILLMFQKKMKKERYDNIRMFELWT